MDNRKSFDRTLDDVGNIVELGHVNLTVPDQALATIFYVLGLGLTRDPYMMPGLDLMWVNVGRAQFHLPTRAPTIMSGVIGLVVPDLDAAERRFCAVRGPLASTQFGYLRRGDCIEATCPWGNRLRLHAPDPARFGAITLDMPYLEFEAGPHARLAAIRDFYVEILGAVGGMDQDARGDFAWVAAGPGRRLIFRGSGQQRPFDGHHLQITLADFSHPYRKLAALGLVTRDADPHEYRFQDVVDPSSRAVLFTVEHEVRSMRHPLFGRALVNRDPDQTNRNYAPGYESWRWALRPES
ncbi:MAG TPA: hypothetical protein VFA81_03025 [Burkholderiales bacterium]|nr:hypothetical protein [Burkholderiales bacterium]